MYQGTNARSSSAAAYEAMNSRSPSVMGFESISSSDLDEHALIETPPASNDTETILGVGVSASTWRVAHTLKNHDNVKLESPTAPALTFWYITYLMS